MKLLLYCTKNMPWLLKHRDNTFGISDYKNGVKDGKFVLWNDLPVMNGKIVAECDFEVEKICFKHKHEKNTDIAWYEYKGLNIGNEDCELLKHSCLTFDEISDYLLANNGYAIHIKNLHIFDEPRELEYYYAKSKQGCVYMLNKAPQNMMHVYDEWRVLMGNIIYDKYILISIRPEWLCKILNGKKAIEIRKKVLKEMLKND